MKTMIIRFAIKAVSGPVISIAFGAALFIAVRRLIRAAECYDA